MNIAILLSRLERPKEVEVQANAEYREQLQPDALHRRRGPTGRPRQSWPS